MKEKVNQLIEKYSQQYENYETAIMNNLLVDDYLAAHSNTIAKNLLFQVIKNLKDITK